MVEMKVALAMTIQKYSFILTPAYVHAPIMILSLQPQHGAQLVFKRLIN